MTKAEKITLLPCPFCGDSRAAIMTRSCTGISRYFQAECTECGATSHGSYHLDKNGAAKEWNTRLAAQSAGEPPRALSLMEMGKKAFERFPDEGIEETKRAMGTARYGFMEGLRAALSVPPGDQAERNEIIEECAKIAAAGAKDCTEGDTNWHQGFRYAATNTALRIADRIRSLGKKP